jgi:hypothetical protein
MKGLIYTDTFYIVRLDERGALNRLSGLHGSCLSRVRRLCALIVAVALDLGAPLERARIMAHLTGEPKQRALWKHVDSRTRRKLFDPVKIRIALDKRDGDTTKKRQAEYNKLSELASHATFRGFQLTTRGGFGELGPFVEKINLMAWLEEMVLRLGPSEQERRHH